MAQKWLFAAVYAISKSLKIPYVASPSLVGQFDFNSLFWPQNKKELETMFKERFAV